MSGAQKDNQAAARAPEMVDAVIAPRRSLFIGGRTHGPGTRVSIPVDEHARLLGLGFLHDARVPQLEPGIGPAFRGPVGGVIAPK
jgi:hypothetical protein